jgi:hypothetical protein
LTILQFKRISQEFSENDAVWGRYKYFVLKFSASVAAGAFCRLHNDKYTKFQPIENLTIIKVLGAANGIKW